MPITDPSTAECLRMLLEDQAARLRMIASLVAGSARHRMPHLPPADWSGPARTAYDGVAERLSAELEDALRCLQEAAEQSARAAGTLESRG
jgi:hypothetical protein